MRDYKLANVLTKPDDFAKDYPGLYWHAEGGEARYDESAGALQVRGTVDFTSFLNVLSIGKWRRYTCVHYASLTLTLRGDECQVYATELPANAKAVQVAERPLVSVSASDAPQTVTVPLPQTDSAVQGFRLVSSGTTLLEGGHYSAQVPENSVRQIELALSTTTFKKEKYITHNVEAIKREVLGCDDPVASHFHMYVVDNGRTLPAQQISDAGVTVIPNDNVGGAGGFARGMLAALDAGATHVLLMDDDVHVLPESFKRTFALLSLANDRYRDAFVNGAMLNAGKPNELFEDVAHVRRDGIYGSLKRALKVDRPEELSQNEAVNVEVPNAYGAWWYSCIPTSAIREHGLPLPVFVRCDDVEFGIRCQPTYMTMNGICVWHEQFEGRFNAAVDSYQYTRNFLIMQASDGIDVTRPFFMRFDRTFHIYLRSMNYGTCELMLDGLADFLKGPSFIEHASGEKILMANSQKKEKLVPLDQLDQSIISQAKPDMRYLGEQKGRPFALKLLEELPHDRHELPDALLSDKPAPVYYCRGAYPARKAAFRKVLVAYDATGTKACIRHMDRARWRQLNERYAELTKAFWDRKDQLWREYSEARPYLTSQAFWRKYLHMDQESQPVGADATDAKQSGSKAAAEGQKDDAVSADA